MKEIWKIKENLEFMLPYLGVESLVDVLRSAGPVKLLEIDALGAHSQLLPWKLLGDDLVFISQCSPLTMI